MLCQCRRSRKTVWQGDRGLELCRRGRAGVDLARVEYYFQPKSAVDGRLAHVVEDVLWCILGGVWYQYFLELVSE